MKNLFNIALLLVTVMSTSSMAQNIPFEKEYFKLDKEGYKLAVDNIEDGDYYFDKGEYYMKDAIPFYEAANEFNPNNDELNFKLGVCYYHTRQNQKAIDHLEKCKSLNLLFGHDINYYLGKSYQRNLEWDKAIIAYEFFAASREPDDTENLELAKKYIGECNTGKRLSAEPIRVWVDNLGENINTEHHEYGVAINADASTMMFTSRRPENIGGLTDPATNDFFEDIYYSERVNGEWTPAKNIGEPINDKGHNASISLSNDGMELILFKGNERTLGDLYLTDKYDGEFHSAYPLSKYINSKYHESSASISPDKRRIFFVSERPEG